MADIILTNMSRIREDASFRNYSTDDMGVIKGRYTNEAPVKYLVNSIYHSEPDAVCSIIAITTQEAREAFVAFRQTMKRYCKRNNYGNLSIESVMYDGKFGTVIDEIIKRTKRGDKIYIDTTGGFRDSVYILMAVVRILEYSGIRLEKAVYAVYNARSPKDNRIIDITGTYDMFDLINAANSFISLGNSDELESFFCGSDNYHIKKAIDVMNRFSDEVALCRTSKLDRLMTELNEILVNLQDLSTVKEDEILFKSISGVIREKFGVRDGRKIDYIDVIRWCLDNKMIQQAVTIYVEKMPEFLFQEGFLTYDEEKVDKSVFQKTFDEYYNLLYNGFLKQTTSITFSPYPIGNVLLRLKKNSKNAYKALCNADSIDDLSMKDQLTEDEKRGIQNLLFVKNAVFSGPNTKRPAESITSSSQHEGFRAFAESGIFSKASNTEAFVNMLLKNEQLISLIQGEFTPYEPRVWNCNDINVVVHLERVLNENNGMYAIRSDIGYDDMKHILQHLIYVKRYVRNALNHASEKNGLVAEYKEYFGGIGYNVDTELSVREIANVLRDAITLIRKYTA